MTATDHICSVAAPGVEVVTTPTGAGYVTIIHNTRNGKLDGERFTAVTVLGSKLLHKSALELAKEAARDK